MNSDIAQGLCGDAYDSVGTSSILGHSLGRRYEMAGGSRR